MATDTSNTPYFGPHETPDLFAKKRTSKLRTLLYHGFVVPPDTSNPIWMCTFVEDSWQHVVHFRAQAAKLAVNPQDFPVEEEQLQDFEGERPTGLEHFLPNVPNPFLLARVLMGLAGTFLRRLEEMKTEGEAMCGIRWQDLPLKHRQEANELILKILKAKEEGWWSRKGDDFFADGRFRECERKGAWM